MNKLGKQPWQQPASLSQKWQRADWAGVSFYCLVSRVAYLDPARARDAYQRLDGPSRSFKLVRGPMERGGGCAVRLPPDLVRLVLKEVFGLDDIDINLLQGHDLADQGNHAFVCSEFRYCAQCLLLGYHAILHQHLALSECSTHKCRLRTGCPKCGKKIGVSLREITSDPFACSSCHHLLINPYAINRHAGDLKALDSDLAAIGSRLRGHMQTHARCQIGRDQSSLGGAMLSKTVRRFVVWERELGWGDFREEAFEAHGSGSTGCVADAAEEAFSLLYAAAKDHWKDIAILCSSLFMSSEYIRLHGRASAVAVALCKTAFMYNGTLRLLALWGQAVPGSQTPKLHGYSPFTDTLRLPEPAIARLGQLEIFGTFAHALVSAARAERLIDFDWSPSRSAGIKVPWSHSKAGDCMRTIRMRPRANEKSVLRLIKRYRGHVLTADEDEPGLSARTQKGEVARLST